VTQGKTNSCGKFFRVFPIDKLFQKRVDKKINFESAAVAGIGLLLLQEDLK
jgi:hypothetical protein